MTTKLTLERIRVSFKTFIVSVIFAQLLIACGGGGGGGSAPTADAPGVAIAGRAMAGTVAYGTVTAYELGNDGRSGRKLGTATTDADGAFRLVLSSPVPGAVRLAVSGGSYTNLANAASSESDVALSAVVPSIGSSGVSGIAITPLTSFADKRLITLLAAETPLTAALAQAESTVRLSYGISDGASPLYSLLPNFRVANGDAAILALLLGAFDQLAILQGRTSTEIYRAVIDDFADGVLDGRTTSGEIRFSDTVPAPATLATAHFLGAINAYIAPTNTTTVLARNGLSLSPSTLAAVQGGVASQLRATWSHGGNNSALMNGAAVGVAVSAVDRLRKRIGVSVLGPNSSLSFGEAYATRSDAGSEVAYIVLPVTNVGTKTLCFVKLANLQYKAAGGGPLLVERGYNFVHGSVRTFTASSISTNSCLGPAESGLVTDIRLDVSYSALVSMEFSVEAVEGGSVTTAARILPQAYTMRAATGDSSTLSLSITLKNVGSGPASLSGFHRWALFDGNMVPLRWGFAIDDISPLTPLAAGATGSISAKTLYYDGTGRRLLVLVDFDGGADTGPTANDRCTAEMLGESLDACRQAVRTRQLSAVDAEVRRAQAAEAERARN